MFINNPASTRSILSNNENAMASRRSKSIGENGTKKATFNENSAKTPHRNKDPMSKGGGQTTQRRRRALGDVTNRKSAGGGGAGGKGVVVLKQASSNNSTQGSLKSGNGKALFPTSSTKNRTSQVKFSKAPSTKSTASNKARLGGRSGLKSVSSKPKQRTKSEEYDGIYGASTRLAHNDVDDDSRSIFERTGISKEDLFMIDDLQDELADRTRKEDDERDRLELKRAEDGIQKMIGEVHEQNRKDMDALGSVFDVCGIDDTDEWDVLNEKLPWEEEDYDPTEERRLSGSDPYSLWGDILG